MDEKREVTIQKVFSKYILRIILALAICCVLFRGFDMIMNGEKFSLMFIPLGLWNMITEGSWAHLWYLYLLIGLYLLLPFYRKIALHSTDSELRYLLVVYLIFISVLQISQMAGFRIAFYIHVSTIYPFYLFAGYVISRRKVTIGKGASAALILGGAAGMVLATWIRWTYEFEATDCLLGYSSVFVAMLACGVFAVFYNAAEGRQAAKEGAVSGQTVSGNVDGSIGTSSGEGQKQGFLSTCLVHLDENSFGIYLLHMMLVRLVLRYWAFNPYTHGGPLMFAALVIAIGAVTYVVVWLLRRIPAVRKVL